MFRIDICGGVSLDPGVTYTGVEICVREPFAEGSMLQAYGIEQLEGVIDVDSEPVLIDLEGRAKIRITNMTAMVIQITGTVALAEIIT